MTRFRATVLLTLLATIALCATASSTVAQPEQSPAELRAENDHLREEVERLRGEVQSMQERLDRQDRLIEQLRDTLRKARAGNSGGAGENPAGSDDESDSPAEPEVAPIPSDPFAAPASMALHLLQEHSEAFPEPDVTDARAKQEYLRALRAWGRDAARQATGQIQWRVRTESLADAEGSAVEATFVVVDPSSGLPIGGSFPVRVTGRNSARLRDAGEGAVWILEGVLRSEIEIDESVTSVDLAGGRRYVGECAIFTFDIAVRALREAD